MHEYRDLHSKSVHATTTALKDPQAVQPAPTAKGKIRQTRFKVRQPDLYATRPSPQEYTVETEFTKYTSGEVSASETDVLWFWEVRFFY
jgi:hypothetical protein